MNIYRQLLRRPLFTASAFLMLTAAGIFFCLSFGALVSANATREKIEKNFATVAYPTNEEINIQEEWGDGVVHRTESVITQEMWEELIMFPESVSAVKGIYKQQFINAYCPEITTVITAQEPGRYRSFSDDPYNDAVFLVTVTDIANPVSTFARTDTVWKTVTVTVEQAVALHPGYTLRDKLILQCTFQSAEEYLAAKLKIGERYLVYGTGYCDLDLLLRTDMAEWKVDKNTGPEDIDLGSVTCDLSEYEEYLKERERLNKWDSTGRDSERIAAVYQFSDGKEYFLKESEFEWIGAATLSLWFPVGFDEEFLVSVTMVDETEREFSNEFLVNKLSMIPLEGELSDFLESEEGAEWAEKIEETKIRHSSVPVLGTDFLEGLYQFHQHETSIVEGRTFSEADYRRGNKVCVISDQMARASGLKTGDTLDLSFYWNEMSYRNLLNLHASKETNLTAQEYSRHMGFLEDGSSTYEIIGIYRQSAVWDPSAPYGFTPNTVFVPNASLREVCYSGQAGIFTTFMINNGGIEEVKEAVAEKGWPESTLLYYDGGYSEISDMIDGFSSGAVWLFAVSFLVWIAVLAVYLALFVYHQRRTAGLMLSLGAGRRGVVRFLFTGSMLPVAAAQTVGAVFGALFLNGMLQSVFNAAGEALNTDFGGTFAVDYTTVEKYLTALPWTAFAGALIQLLLYAAAVFVCARRIAGKPPLGLMRK